MTFAQLRPLEEMTDADVLAEIRTTGPVGLAVEQIGAIALTMGTTSERVRGALAGLVYPPRFCAMCGGKSGVLDDLRHCKPCREEIPR